jgi:hypothetical protein
LRAVRFFSE